MAIKKRMFFSNKKIAIIGYGAIAKYVYNELKFNKIKIDFAICKQGKEDKAKEVFSKEVLTINSIKNFETLPDLVLDCAGHSALEKFAADFLSNGVDFITLSSGALANDKLYDIINKASKKGGSNFYIASGAIGSLDLLNAANQGNVYKVTYTGRKPPRGWIGSRAENVISLQNVEGEKTHFFGSAREAALLYPKNANVAATIAISGIGFDKTSVKLIADNSINKNIHELEIEGEFGISKSIIEGLPLPDNPRSSLLAAMSMVSEVKKVLRKN